MKSTYKSEYIVVHFTVEGDLPFPVDMMCYDSCVPDIEEDAHRIESTLRHENKGVVKVNLRRFYPEGGRREPHAPRWKSFGWRVVTGREFDR